MSRISCIGSTLLVVAGLAASSASAQELVGQIPAQFRGVWAADCNAPQMRFDETSLEILTGQLMTGTVIKSVVAGDTLEIHYTAGTPPGTAVDVLRIEGDKLRLVETRIVGMGTATWKKQPWHRCGGAAAQVQPAQQTAAGLSLASIGFPGEPPAVTSEDWLANIIPEMVEANGGTPCQANQAWHWPQASWQAQGIPTIIQGVAATLTDAGAAVRQVEGGPDNILFVRADPPAQSGTALMLTFYLHEQSDLYLVACET